MVDEVLFTSEVAPLAPNVPIVDLKNGNPTSYFMRVISTWLKEKKLTEDQLFGLGMDGLNDVDTVSDPPTTGDLLIFDGTFWVPFAPGASGKVLTSAGDTNMPTWETPDTGSGGGYFGSWVIAGSGADTQSDATKGHNYTPAVDVTITAMYAYYSASSSPQNHHAHIATCDASTGTIGVPVATGTDVPTTSTGLRWYRLPFSSPVNLTAGTNYLLAVVNASGTGSTAVRLGGVTSGIMVAPGAQDAATNKQFRYATIDTTASQVVSASSSSVGYNIFLEGYPTP